MSAPNATSADRAANRGFHEPLPEPLPYPFVDGCVQIWADADLEVAHRHGVSAYAVTAFLPWVGVERALKDLMYWHLVARENERIGIAWSAEDITRAHADGRTTLLLASQDGSFIGDELHRVEAFHRLGLRMMIPAYNRNNLLCGGCLDRNDPGLSALGVRVVEECNRVGLLLDCSHLAHRSSLDVIHTSDAPVVFSHANPRALFDNPRNITDEQIRACAERGGLIGAVCWGPLVYRGQEKRPDLGDFVDAIDYLAQLLGGTDNIGIGTDFSLGSYPFHDTDPWGAAAYADVLGGFGALVPPNPRARERFTEGFDTYRQLPEVVAELERRGYGESDVAGIFGGNFLRVAGQVWK